MNRYKIALKKSQDPNKMDPDLEMRLRNGATAWMKNQHIVPAEVYDPLAHKAMKAHMVSSKLFPDDPLSDDCMKTAGDLMLLDEDKIDKILSLLKSGK
jgi:hypothetical protein